MNILAQTFVQKSTNWSSSCTCTYLSTAQAGCRRWIDAEARRCGRPSFAAFRACCRDVRRVCLLSDECSSKNKKTSRTWKLLLLRVVSVLWRAGYLTSKETSGSVTNAGNGMCAVLGSAQGVRNSKGRTASVVMISGKIFNTTCV